MIPFLIMIGALLGLLVGIVIGICEAGIRRKSS